MSREGSLDLLQEVEESLDIMRQTQHIKPVKVKAISARRGVASRPRCCGGLSQ